MIQCFVASLLTADDSDDDSDKTPSIICPTVHFSAVLLVQELPIY